MKFKLTAGFTYGSEKGMKIPPETAVEYQVGNENVEYMEIPLVNNERETEKE